MYDIINDTIVAISSPPGRAVRGVVRCSGPDSVGMAASQFDADETDDLAGSSGFRRYRGGVTIGDDCEVPGELYVFRGPRSYTRQDLVEFHVAGAPPVLSMLCERLIALGARQAQAGEFTARAFLNGAMDLTQAEAVAGMIRARSDAQLHAANELMHGRLRARVDDIIESLAELTALVEADIDFAEEPIDFISPAEMATRLASVRVELEAWLSSAASAERFEVLPRVVLVGPSNAGKSTLMNRLTGMDRSICSPMAGTTRDTLSAPMRIGHGEVLLIDSAGVDDEASGLMRMAAERSLEAARQADIRCLVFDVSTSWDDLPVLVNRHRPHLLVANKIDLIEPACVPPMTYTSPCCRISAMTGDGIDDLRRSIDEQLNLPDVDLSDETVLLNARHQQAIRDGLASIANAESLTAGIEHISESADLIAFEIRDALDALGAIAGSVTTEDLLGRIFGSFCIGK